MRKTGFTLVELLAVIVILIIILTIAVPVINNIIESTKIDTFIIDEKIMATTAKIYVGSNEAYLPSTIGDTKEIKLSQLEEEKLIDVIKDPWNTNDSCEGYVLITKIDNSNYDYNPYLRCESNYKADGYIADGLAAYWELNNNAYDYTPSNHNGDIHNVIGGTNRFGIEDSAMEFQGASNFIDTNYDYSFNYDTGTTITLWVNFSTIDTRGKTKDIFGKNSWEYILSQIDNKIVSIIWDSNGDYATRLISNINIKINTWYDLALVYDEVNKIFSLYINGILDTSGLTKAVSFVNKKESLKIGKGYPEGGAGSSSFFIGNIDNISIYNRAFSSHEVELYYNIDMKSDK